MGKYSLKSTSCFAVQLVRITAPRFTYAGTTVEGTVDVVLSQPKIVSDVDIYLEGVQELKIPDNGKDITSSTTVLAKKTIYLVDDNERNKEWDVGAHCLPFKFELPDHIPAAHDTDYGTVYYTLKAGLSTEKPYLRFTDKVTLHVDNIVDITEQRLQEMKKKHSSHMYQPAPWYKKGFIDVSIVLPKTGFCLGESIPFTARIVNKTRHDLHYTDVALVQKTTYKGKEVTTQPLTKKTISLKDKKNDTNQGGNTAEETKKVIKEKTYVNTLVMSHIEREKLQAGRTHVYPKNTLKIPIITPPKKADWLCARPSGGEAIRIEYYVRIKAHAPSSRFPYNRGITVTEEIPVVIGSLCEEDLKLMLTDKKPAKEVTCTAINATTYEQEAAKLTEKAKTPTDDEKKDGTPAKVKQALVKPAWAAHFFKFPTLKSPMKPAA